MPVASAHRSLDLHHLLLIDLTFFGANMLVGWLGSLYTAMPAARFWLMHAAIMLAAAAILLVVRKSVGKILAPPYEAPA